MIYVLYGVLIDTTCLSTYVVCILQVFLVAVTCVVVCLGVLHLHATHCPPDESQPVIERGDASTHASVATACVARMRMATPVRLQSAAEPRAPVLLRSGLRARRQSLFVRSVGLERLPSSV